MFDIELFSECAKKAEKIQTKDFWEYVASFDNLIIWGAGNLGTAVGAHLLNENIKITEYWDRNYANIKQCNGIGVKEPFSADYDIEKTCIIGCIVNGSLGEDWVKNVTLQNGYSNYISGMTIYEGVICPLNSDYFDITECTKRKACSLCNCERYLNLLQNKINSKDETSLQLLTFIISTRCTLNCKHCGQRLAYYEQKDKRDIDAEVVKHDFDRVMDNIDFVGMISVIGGEPFIHPQLDSIVTHMLKKGNFGVINITTNGVVKINRKTLENIKNDRVKISFSIYDAYLSDTQKEIIQNNIKLVEEVGINYSTSKPLWVIPPTVERCDITDEELVMKKRQCGGIKMQISVKEGYIYSCGIADSMEGLHIADVGDGRISLYGDSLKDAIKKWLEQPYYNSCRYCKSNGAIEIIAGEQIARY